jgi:hypothetical protein
MAKANWHVRVTLAKGNVAPHQFRIKGRFIVVSGSTLETLAVIATHGAVPAGLLIWWAPTRRH